MKCNDQSIEFSYILIRSYWYPFDLVKCVKKSSNDWMMVLYHVYRVCTTWMHVMSAVWRTQLTSEVFVCVRFKAFAKCVTYAKKGCFRASNKFNFHIEIRSNYLELMVYVDVCACMWVVAYILYTYISVFNVLPER